MKHQRRIFGILLSGFLLAGLLAGEAFGVVVYTQGATPNAFSRSDEPSFGKRVADDFLLASATTVRSVTWQGVYFPSSVNPADDFTIYFYNDGAGSPLGAPIASFNVGNAVNRQDIGSSISGSSLDVYDYAADLGAGIAFSAGTTYWMSIVNDTSSHPREWGWVAEFPTAQPLGLTHRSSDGGVTWPESFNETMTFALDDEQVVPEPSRALLSLLGLLAIVVRRRRVAGI